MARANKIAGFFEDYDIVEEQVQAIVAQQTLLEITRCEQLESQQVHWVFAEYQLKDPVVYQRSTDKPDVFELVAVDCVVFEQELDCWDVYHDRFSEVFEQARL